MYISVVRSYLLDYRQFSVLSNIQEILLYSSLRLSGASVFVIKILLVVSP